jgi:hypothetical protein
MKHLNKILLALSITAATLLGSCKEDDDPTSAEPSIVVTPTASNQAPGQTVPFSIAVTGEGKLAKVTLNGTEIKSYSADATIDAFNYNYQVPADAALGTLDLEFVVTDKGGQTSETSATISITSKPVEVIEANITANKTLVSTKSYLLKGNIFVTNGAKLTIEPGTIIYGDKPTKAALIVERGAKIEANGTAANPVVFTSSAPKNFRNYGDWGGVIILGKAKNNQNANQNIEGITAGEFGKYGGDGTTEDDNSGIFKYVRIEFAGIALSTDNEINGLTLGSVGSGTEMHHIQVSYSGDDSFEWFGGTVNAQYLIAYRGWDDDFDTDFGFTGNVQYAVSFRDPNIADKSGSNGFESDNDGTGTANLPKTAPKFSNVTWFGPHAYSKLSSGALAKSAASSNFQFGGHLRRNSDIQIYNSVFVGSQLETIHFDKTGAAAMFKGNYIGRIGVGAPTAGTASKTTAGNGFNDANFATDNVLEPTALQVDLSSKIAGLTAAANIDTPAALLANGSALLNGAATVPAGLTQTTYIGAFDATTNWATGTWVNYTPNSTDY